MLKTRVKKICRVIFILLLLCVITMFMPANIYIKSWGKECFEFNVENIPAEFNVGDEIIFTSHLKNKTFHSFVLSHTGFCIVDISYKEAGKPEDRNYSPAIKSYKYFPSFQTFTYKDEIAINKPGNYFVYIKAIFELNGKQIVFRESFNITVT